MAVRYNSSEPVVDSPAASANANTERTSSTASTRCVQSVRPAHMILATRTWLQDCVRT